MTIYEPAVDEQGRDSEQWPAPGAKAGMSGGVDPPVDEGTDDDEELPTSAMLMSYARAAVQLSDTSDQGSRRRAMAKSWRAFNNQHTESSRYSQEHYKSRSRLFVPKTRANVLKNAVATAQALFSTNDVVEVAGENESDPRQRASASVIKALLNYRLDRTAGRAGIPWFWIAIAAAIDTQVSGVVVSKQFWEYEYVWDTFDPAPVGDNVVDLSGAPLLSTRKKRIILDRPKIDLHPPENVIVDMAAPFWDVIQGGAFLIVKHPMHVGDVRTMMKPGRNHMGGGAWFSVPEKVLRGSIVDYANTSVRTARDRGRDNLSSANTPNVNDLQIVWVHENFITYGGRDYQFWSLGTQQLLSEPLETIEAYPAHKGSRPYTMGVGSIEPHNAMPMSPVEAVQPLQDELNDHRNLGVDTARQCVAPIAKIRRGAKIDFRQMRKRGPETNILVDEPDDVTFEMPPSNLTVAFQMQDRIANEMDEASGAFSNSSVQQNRNLNETVGGMQIMSASAGGKQEYDVRIFSETWAEDTLRQVTWLLQYYETDDRILSIAGNRAKLFEKYEIDPQQDPEGVRELLNEDVTLKLSIGTGASDPMQRLQKFVGGLKALYEMAQGGVFGGQVTPKAKEIFDEVLALTGYPEAERFFTFLSPEDAEKKQAEQPNPDKMQLELEAKKTDADIADKQKGREIEEKRTTGELAIKGIELKQRMAESAEERDLALRQQDHTEAGQAHEVDLKERDYGIREQSGKDSHALAVAGHNQKMLEAAPPVEGVKDPASAMQEAVGQFQQIMVMLAEGQKTQTEQIGMMGQQIGMLAQAQSENSALQSENLALLREVVIYQRAPRHIIRDASGRVAGVQIGDFEMQPVERATDGRIEGM